jgi:hypothetical protein
MKLNPSRNGWLPRTPGWRALAVPASLGPDHDRYDVRTDLGSQRLNSLAVPLGRNYPMLLPVLVPGVSTRSSGNSFGANPDQRLKAYAWVADRTQPKPKYMNNQYGGTVGGPVTKNRLFYSVSFEGTALRQQNAVYSHVPTAAIKSGNLSAAPNPGYDPLTGNADGSGRTAFPGGTTPESRIDRGVHAIIGTGQWQNLQ